MHLKQRQKGPMNGQKNTKEWFKSPLPCPRTQIKTRHLGFQHAGTSPSGPVQLQLQKDLRVSVTAIWPRPGAAAQSRWNTFPRPGRSKVTNCSESTLQSGQEDHLRPLSFNHNVSHALMQTSDTLGLGGRGGVEYSTVVYCTLLHPTLLYSTPPYSSLLYSLLYSLLFSTLFSSLLFSSLLYFSLLFSFLSTLHCEISITRKFLHYTDTLNFLWTCTGISDPISTGTSEPAPLQSPGAPRAK